MASLAAQPLRAWSGPSCRASRQAPSLPRLAANPSTFSRPHPSPSPAPAPRPQQHRPSLLCRSGDHQVQPQSAVTAALMDSMRQKIGEALETQQVKITDAYGDGRHVSIDVVSPLFEGKSAMQRQRLVYKVRRWVLGPVGRWMGRWVLDVQGSGVHRSGVSARRCSLWGASLAGAPGAPTAPCWPAGCLGPCSHRIPVPIRDQLCVLLLLLLLLIAAGGGARSLLFAWTWTGRAMAPAQAIWFELQEAVHAVDAMTTKTPAEAA